MNSCPHFDAQAAFLSRVHRSLWETLLLFSKVNLGKHSKFQSNILHRRDVCTACVAASFLANVHLLSEHRCCCGATKHTDHSVKGLLYYSYIIACIWQCLEEPGPGAQEKPLVRLISGSTFTQACRSKWNPKRCLVRTPKKWARVPPDCRIFWPFQAIKYHYHCSRRKKSHVEVVCSVSCVWSFRASEEVKRFGDFGCWLQRGLERTAASK